MPAALLAGTGRPTVDLMAAFVMLGTLTMPNILSTASPARFWAWLRYFLAPAPTPDLRIIQPFADLDPHQKGILSDDFGVAISTQWLYDRLGGFADIVDGRRFISQFSRLLRRRKKTSTAKVGPGKAPDFVIQDYSGKWHVLECKGTQSGRGTRNGFLRTALLQKHAIQIRGHMRGERLAAGLAISDEKDKQDTQLRIIDPDPEPLITLGDDQIEEMEDSVYRLSIARGLGLLGLDAMANELAFPSDVEFDDEFLRPSEAERVKISPEQRREEAVRQMRERRLTRIRRRGQNYEGRSFRFDIPGAGEASPFNTISIRQGVSADLVQSLASVGSDLRADAEKRARPYSKSMQVKLESDGTRASLTQGDFLFSEVRLWRS